jgi:imidazoleglycerol phosphate dehydratase HisB
MVVGAGRCVVTEAVVVERTTRETAVRVAIPGQGERVLVRTDVPMLSHLLEQLGWYWGLGLEVEARDLAPLGDGHHLAEDVGIALGRALDARLGDRAGIARFGQRLLPMDEALARVAVDAGGRAFFAFSGALPSPTLGGLASECVPHLLRTLATEARLTLHVSVTGASPHHMAEACFKAVGLALAEALAPSGRVVLSTKGVLG